LNILPSLLAPAGAGRLKFGQQGLIFRADRTIMEFSNPERGVPIAILAEIAIPAAIFFIGRFAQPKIRRR
jgi:hypothetical protein